MFRARWVVLSIITLVLIAYGSFTWVNSLLDSILAYRSPLHAAPPMPGAPLGQPMASRVVLVIVDALRDETSRRPDVMPFLNQLRRQGAWATMHSQPPSFSQPAWTTIATGAWPEINDAAPINVDTVQVLPWTQDNIFAAAKRAGYKTAVSGHEWWGRFVSPGLRDAGFFTAREDDAADRDVVNAAMPWLVGGGYPLVLIHLDQVDYAGHSQGGPRDPRWNVAAMRADGLLKQIAGALDYDRDSLIVVSDHGQIDRGGHGGQDPITLVEPFVMAGPGVRPGQYPDIQPVDVAPTIAVLLGTNLPATGEGKPLTQMLDADTSRLAQIAAAWNVQQDAVASAYEKSIDVVRQSPMTDATAYARIVAARDARDWNELWPRRIVLASVVALIGAGVLIGKRSRGVAMLFLGAILYALAYNLVFAVIAGNVYSLSTVPSTGATGLAIQVAMFTLIATVLAWLAAMLLSGALRRGALHAAQATYGFAFITLYLLSLPVLLGFAVDGATTTWRLPDFLLAFLHFTNLMQAMLVAALGIVLSGVAALVGWRMKAAHPTP